MATSTLLSNPVFTINAVDVSDQTTSLSPQIKQTALPATAFGDSSVKYTAGLFDNQVTAEMYWSEAASETYATLKSLIGTTTTITWKAAVGATSATNVLETLTGCYLEELAPVYKMGELSTISVTFLGGVYSAAIV